MKKIMIFLALILIFAACDKEAEGENNEKEVNPNDPNGEEVVPVTEVAENPIVTIEFESGEKVLIELYPEYAPNTVNNFISLINKGFYNGLTFHRIIESFMIQGGDPDGNGTGGPGYSIYGEMKNNGFSQNTLRNDMGTIAMARSQSYDSAGSQFYINVNNNTNLNDEYTVFGKVIENYEYVETLSKVDVDSSDKPVEPVVIKTMTVDTKGVDYPEPEIIQ